MLLSKFSEDPTKNPSEFSEKEVITYTAQIEKFLGTKATLFDTSKPDFDKADEELKKQVTHLAEILWGGAYRKAKFTEKQAIADKSTKSIVENMTDAIKELQTRSNEDQKTCKLTSSASSATKVEEKKKTEEEKKKTEEESKKLPITKGPLLGNPTESPATTPAVTPAATPSETPGPGPGPGPGPETQTPPGLDDILRRMGADQTAAQAQQIRDALDAIKRAEDELRRAREDQNLADQNKDNNLDGLLAAIKALGEKNDNQPQVQQPAPQLALPSGGDKQQPQQAQAQPTDQQDKQQAAAAPYPSQQAPAQPLIVPPSNNKINDPAPRQAPIVVQNDAAAYQAEMNKIKGQLLDAKLAALNNRQGMGGPNTNMAKLQNNAVASRQRRKSPSSRMASKSKNRKARFNAGTTGAIQKLGMNPDAAADVVSSRVK